MKKIITLAILILMFCANDSQAQETGNREKYGNTINLGLGLGYYGYVGYTTPALHFDFEIDIARNLTIAPSISIFRHNQTYYWGNKNYPYKYYGYTETVIPVGAKVSYYFDELLKANPRWDFYLAGTAGFKIRTRTWDNDYYGETNVQTQTTNVFVDLHIGSEFHMNDKLGLFLDLSTGMSTFGLAIHL